MNEPNIDLINVFIEFATVDRLRLKQESNNNGMKTKRLDLSFGSGVVFPGLHDQLTLEANDLGKVAFWLSCKV